MSGWLVAGCCRWPAGLSCRVQVPQLHQHSAVGRGTGPGVLQCLAQQCLAQQCLGSAVCGSLQQVC